MHCLNGRGTPVGVTGNMSAADSDITGEPSARDGHRLGKRQRHIGDDEPMEFSQRCVHSRV